MREILFRGKRKDNGEWVEGDLIFSQNIAYIHPKANSFSVNEYGLGKIIKLYEVIPETVGQYTALCDKNGKKIFEGDIFESRASENQEDWKRWLCVYQDGSFCFETEVGKRKKKHEQNLLCEDEIILYGLVVIGNIHDNPELLKGGRINDE